jgi:hypothetical protein
MYLIISAVVHHLRWDRDGGFVYVQMYLFCSYNLSSMLQVLEITLYQLGANNLDIA